MLKRCPAKPQTVTERDVTATYVKELAGLRVPLVPRSVNAALRNNRKREGMSKKDMVDAVRKTERTDPKLKAMYPSNQNRRRELFE
jgi:hypothetical protein